MGLKSFLAEVRRRHVFRVAAWYAVAAWLVIQIAVNIFPHLLLPDWSVRLVIVFCLIGFPIALALAWSLEVTPEGLRVTEVSVRRIPRSTTPPWRSTSMWLALAGGVLLGMGALQAWRTLSPLTDEGTPARVLAVLPFENLGGDEANAAFTAGIHDSLITRIAKIGGMTAISRTSVMAYEGKRPNLKEVAKALGVTPVIEGSVQRSGNLVRIQAQLIDAATDSHLWAETYDRTLAEGFATQNEIATAIVRELSVRLSDQERSSLKSVPTENAEAFEHYILGRAYLHGLDIGSGPEESITKGLEHLKAAVVLDPTFALAFADLSMLYTDTLDLDSAKQTYEQALTLQPDLGEGLLARGVFHAFGRRDFAAAEPDLVRASALLPNNHGAYEILGSLRHRQGRWLEAVELLERSMTIEPTNSSALWSLTRTYSALRQRESPQRAIRRMMAAAPERSLPRVFQASLLVKYDGDCDGCILALEQLQRQFPDDQWITWIRHRS